MNVYADTAMTYFDRGYPCIPTRQDTRTPMFSGYHGARKEPVEVVTNPKKQRYMITRANIEQWSMQYPDANIACVLPPGVLVIDVDGDVGVESFARLVEELKIQPNFYMTTSSTPYWGGHGHYWFAGPEFTATRIRFRPGLDIMGTGSLVHMPPTYSVKRASHYKEYQP